MSRKDYVVIAAALHRARLFTDEQYAASQGNTRNAPMGQFVAQWWTVLDEVTTALGAANTNFDRDRFVKACEGGK